MQPKRIVLIGLAVLVVLGGVFLYRIFSSNQFELPSGETTETIIETSSGTKTIMETGGEKHSIPLDEILSGGPDKDGIPSIDNPKFISTEEANSFLENDEIGLGFEFGDEARFYPFSILVWHELVNDTVAGKPVLVSYCPLCLTAIVFDRKINGRVVEFGVSGKLWRSNLLMYDRTTDPKKESLWSQVLGEAVVGPATGTKLTVLPSNIVKYGDWKKSRPGTTVLSTDTGHNRNYGRDPYGDYYTSEFVSYGATFNDERLHPKAFVLGIEVDGQYKAYDHEALKIGTTTDAFAGETITIEKNEINEISIFIGDDKKPLSYIGGFWFSWLAVHEETELYK